MKSTKIGVILLATSLSFVGVSYALAGNQQGMKNSQGYNNKSGEMRQGKCHGKKQQGMMFSELDLTLDQKQQMREIINSVKANNKDAMREVRSAHRAEMQTIINDPNFDEVKATELISQQQLQNAEQRLEMIKAKHQAFQLLTDEQKTQYGELRAQRQNR
jgi:protein CpxP